MITQNYLFIGSSYDPLIKKALKTIEGLCHMDDVVTYDLSESKFSDVYEDIITPPLFSDKKVILIKSFDLLLQEEAYGIKMSNYLKKPNENVFIVCLSANKQGLKSWLKIIDLYMEIIEVEPYNEIEIQKIIKEALKTEDMKIDLDAMHLLIQRLMLQKDFIHVQLQKLITYRLDTKFISQKDVLLMVDIPLEDNVFEMIQAFISKDYKQTIRKYRDLLYLNEDPIRILSMMGRKLGQLEDTKAMISQGLDQRQIAEALRMSNGQAYYIVKEAKSLKRIELEQWIDQLSTVDYQIKSGFIDKKIGVEIFLLGDQHA